MYTHTDKNIWGVFCVWMTFCVHVCVFLCVQLDECICVFDGDEEPAMNYNRRTSESTQPSELETSRM